MQIRMAVAEHNATKHVGTAAKDVANGLIGDDANAKVATSKLYTDVASGLVIQDASGNATVTGNGVWLTRNGSNIIQLIERTSVEGALTATRTAANCYKLESPRGGANMLVAALDANGDIPHMRPKAASANLRHSHDNEAFSSSPAYTKLKTITFANGISGTLRVSFDLKTDYTSVVYGRVYKNGVAIGIEQSDVTGAYVTKTEDINFGVLAPGDTIELWGYTSSPIDTMVYVRNFRISYDNAADTIAVAGASNS